MNLVKNTLLRVYVVLMLLVIGWLFWRVVDDKLVARSPDYQVVPLVESKQVPVWEATDSLSLAESEEQLAEELSAQAYLAMEIESRALLLEKNLDTSLPPASTTKLMTALVALDLFSLDEVVEVSPEIAEEHDGGGLVANERLTVRSLLIATLVNSANDAAYALAGHAEGGEQAFMEEMNERALAMKLENTRFANPTGYDDPPNVSTARDLSILVLQAIDNPMIMEWISLQRYEVADASGRIRHYLINTNDLLGVDPRVIGGKTGTTALAKEVLVTIAEIAGQIGRAHV